MTEWQAAGTGEGLHLNSKLPLTRLTTAILFVKQRPFYTEVWALLWAFPAVTTGPHIPSPPHHFSPVSAPLFPMHPSNQIQNMWKLILATSVQFYLDVFLSSLYRQVERSETGAGVILPEIMPPKSSGVALPISSKPVSKAASCSFVCGFPWTRIRRKGKPPVGHFFIPWSWWLHFFLLLLKTTQVWAALSLQITHRGWQAGSRQQFINLS